MNDQKFYQSNEMFSFNGDVAKMYGVDCAILIQNIRFWILKNRNNAVNFIDGRTWTYNSLEAFVKQYPFYTYKQIRLIMDKLTDTDGGKKEPVLVTGVYNQWSNDRTKWYAFFDEVKWGISGGTTQKEEKVSDPKDSSMCPKGQTDLPKKADPCAQKGRPLPDTLTDNKKDTYLLGQNELESEKVSKYNSSSPAEGRSHNVESICSVMDQGKLRIIMERIMGKPASEMIHLKKWYKWVKGKQANNLHEQKHGSAWVKSYEKFIIENESFEQAKQESDAKHRAAELKQRQAQNYNPYNDMLK